MCFIISWQLCLHIQFCKIALSRSSFNHYCGDHHQLFSTIIPAIKPNSNYHKIKYNYVCYSFLVIFLLLLHNIFPVSVKTTLLEFVQNQFCPKWKLISSFRLSDLRPGRNPLLPHSEIHYRGHGLCSTLNPNQSYHPYTFVQGSFGKWRQGHSEKQRDVIDTIILQSFTYKHKLKTVHLCFPLSVVCFFWTNNGSMGFAIEHSQKENGTQTHKQNIHINI